MMLEFYNELQCGKGPVFLKLDHLPEETITEIETILHKNERPSRGRFHEGRGTDYRERDGRDAHLRDRLLQRPQRLGRVGRRARGPPCRASMRPATWPACRTTTCSARSPTADRRRARGRLLPSEVDFADGRRRQSRARAASACWRRRKREDGMPPNQIEYKMRRMVNDYLQPPKVTRKMELALERFEEVREDLETGEVEVADAVQQSGVPNLWVLPCGPLPPNPAELLTSPRSRSAGTIREHYDFVIVDTPPLLAVTDPSVVAARGGRRPPDDPHGQERPAAGRAGARKSWPLGGQRAGRGGQRHRPPQTAPGGYGYGGYGYDYADEGDGRAASTSSPRPVGSHREALDRDADGPAPGGSS